MALQGLYTTLADIQRAFEAKVGKTVARSTVYNLLKCHDWRKLSPRPAHPKADKNKPETFKKTFLNS